MTPYFFEGSTAVAEAQPDHDHSKTGEVVGLPIRIMRTPGGPMLMSVWKPSEEELATLMAGGGVALTVFGRQPICSLGVCAATYLTVPA